MQPRGHQSALAGSWKVEGEAARKCSADSSTHTANTYMSPLAGADPAITTNVSSYAVPRA